MLAAYWRRPADDLLEFWIEADSFMRHMNRVLVGTMLQVAGGRRTLAAFRGLLGGAPRAAGVRPRLPTGCAWWGSGTGGSGCSARRAGAEPAASMQTRCGCC